MKKRHLFFKNRAIASSIAVLICFNSFAQTYDTDSLQRIIRNAKEDTVKVNTLIILSKTYLGDFNRLEEVKKIMHSTLKLAEKLGFKKGIAYSYLYYGVYYWRKADYSAAIENLNKSLTVFEEINHKAGIAIANMDIGYIYFLQGKYEKAIPLLLISSKLQEELKDKTSMFLIYNNIGLVYASQGNYAESFNFYLKALKLKEEANDKVGMYKVYNNMGLLFEQQGKMDVTLSYYLKALILEEEVKDKLSIAITSNNIGRIHCYQKKFQEALKYHLKALQLTIETGDRQEEGTSYNNLGLVYIGQNRFQEAILYQSKALRITKEVNDKEGFIITCIALGNTYEKVQNYVKAADYYTRSLTASKNINYKEGIKNAYQRLSDLYTKIKDYEKALYFNNLYYAEKDSILNKDVLNQVAELNTKYETEKKEKEIQLLTKDQQLNEKILQEQKLVRLALVIGLGLLGVLLLSVYKRYHFKKKANVVLQAQKTEIQQKNVLIMDSIDYAKSIQEAILPTDASIKKLLPESFILFKPKDIVSGDFYWVKEKHNKIICIAADCTGHGVPGAFMSLLGFNMLDNITNKEKPVAANILTLLNEGITTTMSQQNSVVQSVKHGMDIAVLIIDKITMQAQYAGAHNPLYYIRDNKLTEIKADKITIGTFQNKKITFTNHIFDIKQEDVFYLFTDGFPDQIGGTHKKKFYYQPFKDLLVSTHQLTMNEQKIILDKTITDWRGAREQMDDILIIGIKIA